MGSLIVLALIAGGVLTATDVPWKWRQGAAILLLFGLGIPWAHGADLFLLVWSAAVGGVATWTLMGGHEGEEKDTWVS